MVGRATEMIVRSIEVTRLAVPRTRTATFQPRGEILAPYMVHGSRQPPGLLLAPQAPTDRVPVRGTKTRSSLRTGRRVGGPPRPVQVTSIYRAATRTP